MAKKKIPKRIAGVKVPKKLRKQVKEALAVVETPVARELAMAGLAIAAAAVVAKLEKDGAKVRARQDEEGAELDLGDMLRATAAEGARRFLEGFNENLPPAARPLVAAVAKKARKPKEAGPPAPEPKQAEAPARPGRR